MKKLQKLILIFCVLFISTNAFSQALVLNPNRIVFEGKTRKDQLIVNNPSEEKQTYRVSFENMQMQDDGKYINLQEKEKNGKYADKLIRFSPRTFTLEPKSSQIVRLMLRKPKKLEKGEYRSHMKVSVVPKTEAPKVRNDESVNIQIQVHYGITIPVIVRNGKLDFKTKVEEFSVLDGIEDNEGKKMLQAKISRSGKRSVYGDLSLIHKSNSGEATVLKFLPGVSIFTPNEYRVFDVPFDIPEDVNLNSGKYELKYTDRESGNLVASKDLKI